MWLGIGQADKCVWEVVPLEWQILVYLLFVDMSRKGSGRYPVFLEKINY